MIDVRHGPCIYHTGDTDKLSDMARVRDIHAPSHVILPLGYRCALSPAQAAAACQEHLDTCHTVIPVLFKQTKHKVGILDR